MKIAKELVKQTLWGLHKLATGRDLARLRIRNGPAKGTRMELDLRKEGAYWLGNYDDWVLRQVRLAHWLKPGQVAWDGGAYIGYYTAIFRKLVGSEGQVVTFEGSSINHQRVARLPELNGWRNVTVRRQAIGPDHSIIEFAANLGGGSGPYGLSKQYEGVREVAVEKVPCAGVDELVDEQEVAPPDFIKFDLESAEEFALHNGARVFTTKRPPMLLELHGPAATTAAARFMETYDYGAWDVSYLHIHKPPLRSREDFKERPPESHMLFCLPAAPGGKSAFAGSQRGNFRRLWWGRRAV